MRAKAAVLTGFGKPLEIRKIDVADPGPTEVRVRIVASGVCGSDAKVCAGRNPLYPQPPVVLGHESAGIVEATGAAVTSVSPGDHVLVAMNRACGRCPECASGHAYLCQGEARHSAVAGRLADGRTPFSLDGRELPAFIGIGSFAEQVVVGEEMLIPVPDEDFDASLALLACAVVTGTGAVWRVARVRPGETVLVVGCGGVGLAVVQAAVLAGAARVIAADVNPAKLHEARVAGATDAVDAGDSLPDAVGRLTGRGVDHAFDVTGAAGVAADAMAATKPGGTTVLVGSPASAEIGVPSALLFGGRVLRGCVGGNANPAADLPNLIELVRTGRFSLDPLVSERVPIEEVNEALARQQAGAVTRSLIVFD
ncbi:alcohol dehydrogenase catalytic domain-containing protein [Amycolatopsis circi]|uniref:alcohol dehydrogenase catalytic domain-containing protein n=1 Tax=Amycolatopsis circi TaxID=871959 RepID=UPI000E222FE4|nr:alcohol dehydrogenase catalytic domain-containing protein [Amycolatopsis circi]